ncbi:hypothetical protein PTKIN_Ptkin01aG0075200 [Pterospermum kingtungense]
MILESNSIRETHYDILSVKQDASYDEIRTSYQSAILNSHPDKLHSDQESDDGEVIELFYHCQCGDHFSVDSSELGKMGYALLRNGTEISLRTPDALPASVVLPCGSCSLLVRLTIKPDIKVPCDGFL